MAPPMGRDPFELEAGEQNYPSGTTCAVRSASRIARISPAASSRSSRNRPTNAFGVVGCPLGHSMSPAIHNAAFDATDFDGVYLPILIQPGGDNFNRFIDAVLQRPWLGWRGLSVTLPHKENALAYVGGDSCDELSRRIGAINTITIDADGKLRGDNSDYAGAIDALCSKMQIARKNLAGRVVAVLGAGGAARAIVAALGY